MQMPELNLKLDFGHLSFFQTRQEWERLSLESSIFIGGFFWSLVQTDGSRRLTVLWQCLATPKTISFAGCLQLISTAKTLVKTDCFRSPFWGSLQVFKF